MNKAASRKDLANRGIPALIAVGSSLAALPASALELGELTVQSRLGLPLRASIAYALAPNEQLSDYCVTVRPGPSVSGLSGFGAATVSVANGVIMLTGKTPVREPMISAHVVVNCPYSANLSREYMVFIDPLISADESANPSAYQPATVTVQTTPQTDPIAVTPAAIVRPVTAAAAEPVQKDISTAMSYRVQPGDIIPDARLDGPTTVSSSPNVPTAIITTRNIVTDGAASPTWLTWLAGSGIALIFGLLMFGRRLRDRSGTSPAATFRARAQRRRFSDTQTTDTENTEAPGVDYDLSDDSPTEENLALDADLVIGTGLEQDYEGEFTAQMPAQNDEISDLDDTGINVEMPAESGKASL